MFWSYYFDVSVDPPRPQPSSSSQISPLVAIVAGVISALFLLASLLVVALRLQCRRAQLRAASAAAVVMSASSGALSSGHRGSVVGGASGGGSETLLLVKSEQLHATTTPLFNNLTDSDDRNPDLIPHRDGNQGRLLLVGVPFFWFRRPSIVFTDERMSGVTLFQSQDMFLYLECWMKKRNIAYKLGGDWCLVYSAWDNNTSDSAKLFYNEKKKKTGTSRFLLVSCAIYES